MFKRVVWPMLLFISLVLIVVFIGGLVASLVITSAQDHINDALSEENLQPEKQVGTEDGEYYKLLLIGDSLATGVGDESGGNLGERYVELAGKETNSIEWKVVNLSVPGSQTDDWVQLLQEDLYVDAVKTADLIFLSIGGNNLNAIEQARSLTGLGEYEEQLKQYLSDLQTIIRSINQRNPDVQVVVIGLYNPYGVSIGEQKIQLLLEWNYETLLRVEDQLNWVYVPLYDLFKYHQDAYLFLDNFHPNEEGYNAIADRIYEVVGKMEYGKAIRFVVPSL